MNPNSQLIEQIANRIPFQPLQMCLIRPLEVSMVKKVEKVLDDEANEGRDLQNEEAIMKDVETTVPSQFQKGVLIKLDDATKYFSSKENKDHFFCTYEPGDVVIFPVRAAAPFDLVAETVLVRSMDIVGKWDIEKEREAIEAYLKEQEAANEEANKQAESTHEVETVSTEAVN